MDDLNTSSANLSRARFLVVLAAVLWSTSGFFAKAPVFDAWPIESRGPMLAFWRAVFASGVLIIMVRRVTWSWKMVPMVCAFAGMNWTYLNALVFCETSMAIWLQYLAPAWACLMGWWLFREPPQRADWTLLIVIVLALVIILGGSFSAMNAGIVYGVLSGICYAGVIVTLRWNNTADAAWLVFLNHVVTVLLFCPVMAQADVSPNPTQWWYLAGFGIIQMGIPYLLIAKALQILPSHQVSSIALLEPVLMPLWVWCAWRHVDSYQAPALTTVIGAVIILTGLLMRYRKL